MFWKWFWRFLVFLLVVGIFVGGGAVIYRAGYSHGYTTGIWASEGEAEVVPPQFYAHPGILHRGYARPLMFFPFFGLCFGFLLLMMIFGGFRRMAYHKMWHYKMEQAGEMPPYPKGWRKAYWHHRAPWCGPSWGWDDKPADEATAKTEETGEAEPESEE